MPFFTCNTDGTNPQQLIRSSVKEAEILENKVRDLLATQLDKFKKPDEIDPPLMLLASEYGNWIDSNRKVDVLALDREGNLVVIEVKRTSDGGHAELQSLRYAAMLSVVGKQQVIQALHATRIQTGGSPTYTLEQAEAEIKTFLDKDSIEVSNRPRIMLVASGFSKEITTTVNWLFERFGVDITCIQVSAYDLGNGKVGLDFDQIYPLPSLKEYQVQMKEKFVSEQKAQSPKAQRAVRILEDVGLLKPGMIVRMIQMPRADLEIREGNEQRARFEGNGQFTWLHGIHSQQSLSPLTVEVCALQGKTLTALQGPKFWAIEGQQVTLAELAKQQPMAVQSD